MQQKEVAEDIINTIGNHTVLTQGHQILISRGTIRGVDLWESYQMMIMNKQTSNRSIRNVVTITAIITYIGTMPLMTRKFGLFRS